MANYPDPNGQPLPGPEARGLLAPNPYKFVYLSPTIHVAFHSLMPYQHPAILSRSLLKAWLQLPSTLPPYMVIRCHSPLLDRTNPGMERSLQPASESHFPEELSQY